MKKLYEVRRRAVELLAKTDSDSPRADIDCLLTHIFGFTKTDIVLGVKEISDEQAARLMSMTERLANGEPVQYITGVCEFMSMNFEVNSHTLIPRADTEVLVETVIELCRGRKNVKILEVGTGSGCIAVSLAKFIADAEVFAVDISSGALETAKRNAEHNGVSDRVQFFSHDIMTGFPKLDFIPDAVVSNPPYIPSGDIDELSRKVRAFEPRTALDGGSDGLDFYRKIVDIVPLKKESILAFEVGFDQSAQVAELMKEKYSEVSVYNDLSGIGRAVIGVNKKGC